MAFGAAMFYACQVKILDFAKMTINHDEILIRFTSYDNGPRRLG